MAKLTKAMRDLLRDLDDNWTVRHFTGTGRVMKSDGQFTAKVNVSTFNALTLRGLISRDERRALGVDRYSITDSGRLALSQEKNDE